MHNQGGGVAPRPPTHPQRAPNAPPTRPLAVERRRSCSVDRWFSEVLPLLLASRPADRDGDGRRGRHDARHAAAARLPAANLQAGKVRVRIRGLVYAPRRHGAVLWPSFTCLVAVMSAVLRPSCCSWSLQCWVLYYGRVEVLYFGIVVLGAVFWPTCSAVLWPCIAVLWPRCCSAGCSTLASSSSSSSR